MDSICQICGRQYTGRACVRCTAQCLSVQNCVGEKPGDLADNIVSKQALGADMARLKLADARVFAVPKPLCRIGHDATCDIIIGEDGEIARFHAQISFAETEGNYVLRDLGTRSGTYLNGELVRLDQAVSSGDRIKIGRYMFVFESDLDS